MCTAENIKRSFPGFAGIVHGALSPWKDEPTNYK